MKIDTNIIFHQPTFDIDENGEPVQPAEIIEYNKILKDLKTIFTTDKVESDSEFCLDYSIYIKFVIEKGKELRVLFDEKKQQLSDIANIEKNLKNRFAELKDRKLLSTKINDIKDTIKNHKIIKLLTEKSSSFNTYDISAKTTEARKQLIQKY